MSTIPENYRDLLTTKKAFANLATLMSDGTPQVTPVWIDFDGEHVLVNTAKGRLKDKNLRVRNKVGLSILDPENPYRYLSIQGKVVGVTEEGADAHIDKMAKKYMDKDSYPFRTPTEVRCIFKIAPEKIHTMG
ncbi:MAG TPA: PPOX class F420-dependent oxidoreductase [Polyangiaceae bacterium]|jgi:PPOX class probable F420-dependent enzyme|nr:PPOX class F420-dependent oxidoreductase [Polyangiaceae bacterium]